MGKTYVALGALALFRHFDPNFRVLVIAPRENIQLKWMKELGNFARHNVRFPDLRVTAHRPVSRLARWSPATISFTSSTRRCVDSKSGLLSAPQFASASRSEKDVDEKAGAACATSCSKDVPWLPGGVLTLRNKQELQGQLRRAVCCALPAFDLVIVDEGHNLKHGFSPTVAAAEPGARFGPGAAWTTRSRRTDCSRATGPGLNGCSFFRRRRSKRATGILESARRLRARAGLSASWPTTSSTDEETRRQVAAKFLVRRVTIDAGRRSRTTRRISTGASGAAAVCMSHDEPIQVTRPRSGWSWRSSRRR